MLCMLKEQQRICCPVSFLLFEELMKQSDPVTLLRTAQLMDYFSGGVCFQFPPEVARNEMRHFLMRNVARQSSESKPWIWTKAGFLAGDLFPTEPALNNRVQKAWTDLMWAIRLEHIIEMLDGQWPPLDFWDKYADASNKDALFYRTSKLRYPKILEREKALLIRELFNEHLVAVGQEVWDEFPQCREPNIIQNLGKTDHSPFYFPSLQILAGINAADMLTKKVFKPNDMLDYRHAALAIPYCDVVCCDHPMATRLRNKPCEFGKVYGTKILGQPEEILDYLKRLAR